MNIAELKELALLIKQETVEEANSSLRIGTAFEEVVKKLGLNEDEISKLREMVEGGDFNTPGGEDLSSFVSTETYTKYTKINNVFIEL